MTNAHQRTYTWIVFALPLGFLFPLPFYFLHRRFPGFGFDYFVTPVLLWYLGYLSVGINSSVGIYFAIGFFVQFWLRKKYPEWFIKYNYLLAAAISGGTELLVFVTTFAVQVNSYSYTSPSWLLHVIPHVLTAWYAHRVLAEKLFNFLPTGGITFSQATRIIVRKIQLWVDNWLDKSIIQVYKLHRYFSLFGLPRSLARTHDSHFSDTTSHVSCSLGLV